MKIAFFSTKSYDRSYFDQFNLDFGYEIHYLEPALNWETRSLAYGFPALCLFVNDRVDGPTLKDLAENGLKLIVLRCAGYNNIDLLAAEAHQITVLRVPAYSPHAVAEHALALILTLNRKTHKAYNRVREQNFSLERLEGFDLYGKTVGVIGTGKIGGAFCKIMLGLGCKVLAFDTFPDEALTQSGIKYEKLEEVLAHSDIISLHCPLTPDTFHIIDHKAVGQLKKGCMLINTSRGALIDTQAVIEGLREKTIAYLGLDVYEQEEGLFFSDLSEQVIPDETLMFLMSFPNVLITAHQAFFTENALAEIAQTTLQNIRDFERNSPSKNQVRSELIQN